MPTAYFSWPVVVDMQWYRLNGGDRDDVDGGDDMDDDGDDDDNDDHDHDDNNNNGGGSFPRLRTLAVSKLSHANLGALFRALAHPLETLTLRDCHDTDGNGNVDVDVDDHNSNNDNDNNNNNNNNDDDIGHWGARTFERCAWRTPDDCCSR